MHKHQNIVKKYDRQVESAEPIAPPSISGGRGVGQILVKEGKQISMCSSFCLSYFIVCDFFKENVNQCPRALVKVL